MKLASLKDGTRDGQLIVVSRDLHTAAIADAIAPTLQRVLDDWAFYAPQLRDLYDALNHGRARNSFGLIARSATRLAQRSPISRLIVLFITLMHAMTAARAICCTFREGGGDDIDVGFCGRAARAPAQHVFEAVCN